MNTMLKFALVLSTAAFMAIPFAGGVRADYRIPDDCLGDWDYCGSLWMDFDRSGRKAFVTLPFEEADDSIVDSTGHRQARKSRFGCQEGREVLASRGFEHVRTVDCRGHTYTYLGRWDGSNFRIRLSSRSGRILDIDLL
jgi:hypothetical protein